MTDIDREALARIPRDLRKERGWSGARSVGIVKLIEERLKIALGLAPPPEPEIDPDLLEARALVVEGLKSVSGLVVLKNGGDIVSAREAARMVEAGEADNSYSVVRTVAAIKRGRELASEQSA